MEFINIIKLLTIFIFASKDTFVASSDLENSEIVKYLLKYDPRITPINDTHISIKLVNKINYKNRRNDDGGWSSDWPITSIMTNYISSFGGGNSFGGWPSSPGMDKGALIAQLVISKAKFVTQLLELTRLTTTKLVNGLVFLSKLKSVPMPGHVVSTVAPTNHHIPGGWDGNHLHQNNNNPRPTIANNQGWSGSGRGNTLWGTLGYNLGSGIGYFTKFLGRKQKQNGWTSEVDSGWLTSIMGQKINENEVSYDYGVSVSGDDPDEAIVAPIPIPERFNYRLNQPPTRDQFKMERGNNNISSNNTNNNTELFGKVISTPSTNFKAPSINQVNTTPISRIPNGSGFGYHYGSGNEYSNNNNGNQNSISLNYGVPNGSGPSPTLPGGGSFEEGGQLSTMLRVPEFRPIENDIIFPY